MAIPSSGQLKLRGNGDGTGIGEEVFGNVTGSNISLHAMSIDAGFTTPDPMGEFYGYSACSVVTLQTNSISSTSQTAFRHNVVWDNPSQCETRYRYYYGTNSTVRSNSVYTKATNNTAVEYDATNYFTGLSPSTSYYVEAFAESALFGTTYAPSKSVTTQAPSLGISWEANVETIAGYTSGDYQNQFGVIDFNGNWYICIAGNGWSITQNSDGWGVATSTLTTAVSNVSSNFGTNWNPYQNISVTNGWYHSGATTISWGTTVTMPNWNGSNVALSCGTGQMTNIRFTKSGYTTNNRGVGMNIWGYNAQLPSDIRLKTNINYL